MRPLVVCLALPLLACASDSTTLTESLVRRTQPAFVAHDAGDGQVGIAGMTVATSPRIQVLDVTGRPLSNIHISCTPGPSSGSTATASTATNAEGKADCGTWSLGTEAGVQTLTMSIGGTPLPPAVFTVRVRAGNPSLITPVTGDQQTATIGTPVARAPVVRVTDAYGNAVQGALVSFTPAATSGAVYGNLVTTDATGAASPALWTLGPTPGAQQLIATVTGANPIVFRATALGQPVQEASRVVVLAGDAQAAAVGTAVSANPTVQVLDAQNLPVKNVLIGFAVTEGGGTVSMATTATDGAGVASTMWIMGKRPGAQGLEVRVIAGAAATTIPLTATALVGEPATILPVRGDGQMAVANTVLPDRPTVRVLDAYDNPVSGVTVIFAVRTGGSRIASGITITDTDGYATAGDWQLGSVVGESTMEVRVGSLATLTFKATVTP
ncbi:MAG: hypothetical protein H3C62_01050 [Gemmatimonadaceae bacterium]|nr:hypothetical protein [Gemmatimonadaceae bacterium]